ncbi:MAG TPA: Tim44/TimA family putative adaptor protein [Devosiaceae bacterium]|nr:Tim44/TimA family putative adaptor protein [Devosiaceae bacterium]
MGDFLDLPTLFFLVLAVVILWRLRSVLGTRTGSERPPFNPYERRREQSGEKGDDNVVALPPRQGGVEPPKLDEDTRALKLQNELERLAPDNQRLQDELRAIAEAEMSFTPKQFLDGAVDAYEMIVTAFAAGNRKTLKLLLDKEVYDSFESEIAAREARDEKVDFTFVGFNDVKFTEAEIDKRTAHVTLEFNAQVISATHNAAGELVDGDEEAIVNIADEWTFARPLRSRDPNWKLIATNPLG